MTKKTRLIAFDYARYEAGAKVVCRNPEIQLVDCYLLKRTDHPDHPLLAIYKLSTHDNFWALRSNGRKDDYYESEYDLLIEEEIEERHFYVNVYKNGAAHLTYNLLENAKINQEEECIGMLKVTYTDEDLIK